MLILLGLLILIVVGTLWWGFPRGRWAPKRRHVLIPAILSAASVAAYLAGALSGDALDDAQSFWAKLLWPFVAIAPISTPLLLLWLLESMGSSSSWRKRAARLAAALMTFFVLVYATFESALAGRPVIEPGDAVLCSAIFLLAIGLAVYGVRADRRSA